MTVERILLVAILAGVVILLLFGSVDIDVSDDGKGRGVAPIGRSL